MSAEPAIHVVFNMSAAGTIRQALGRLGRRERVLGFPDNLSFGPIDPPTARLRQAWIEKEFGYDFEEVVRMADLFWAEAISPGAFPVVWVCRHDAAEYAGFLEFVSRIDGAPFQVVDATRLTYVNGRGDVVAARSLGTVPADAIVAAGAPDRRATLTPKEIEADREAWRRLRGENAPFRVVAETGLVSAPIAHFDETVVACATEEWRSGAQVVGEAMTRTWDGPLGQSVSDLVLWARVQALGEAGVLEVGGDGLRMQAALVRRRRRYV